MKTILLFVFTMVLGLTVNAQSKETVNPTASKAKTTKTTSKTKAGSPMATAPMATAPMAMTNSQERPHVCNPECVNGVHHYQHFEKGHVCGAECKAKAAVQKKEKSRK